MEKYLSKSNVLVKISNENKWKMEVAKGIQKNVKKCEKEEEQVIKEGKVYIECVLEH